MTAPAICPAIAPRASLARSGGLAAVRDCPLSAARQQASLQGTP